MPVNSPDVPSKVRRTGLMPGVPLIAPCSMGTDGFKQAVSVLEDRSCWRRA